MTAVVLGTIVALAAGVLCWMTVSIAVSALWPFQRERLASYGRSSAQALRRLRVRPRPPPCLRYRWCSGVFRFEPARTSEMSGLALRLLAVTGAVSVSVALLRATRAGDRHVGS